MADQLVRIPVKLSDDDMAKFFRQYTYSHFSGWFGVVFGLFTFVMCIRSIVVGDYYYAVIFGLFTYFFLIAPPLGLRKKAKDQIKRTPLFQNRFFYELTKEGIRIYQGKQSQRAEWAQVYRVVGNKNAVYVYTSPKNAWIIPNSAMGEQRDAVVGIIKESVPAGKVKIKA